MEELRENRTSDHLAGKMRRLILASAAAAGLFLLTGSSRGFDLRIEGSPSAPRFAFSGFKGLLGQGPAPALDNLVVGAVGQGPVWAINREPACAPTPSIRFGAVPPGWTQRVAPKPLRDGVVYVVSGSGCGFFGGRTFKILRGQIVSREGTGDAPIREVRDLH